MADRGGRLWSADRLRVTRWGGPVAQILLLMAAVLAGIHGLFRVIDGARTLIRASPDLYVGAGISRQLSIGGAPAEGFDLPLDQLARPGRTIVFISSGECAYSDLNMPNWVDILVAIQGTDVRALAVVPDLPEHASAYWRTLSHVVSIVADTPEQISTRLGVSATPTTLLVKDGVVVHQYQGVLTPVSFQGILAFAGVRSGPDGSPDGPVASIGRGTDEPFHAAGIHEDIQASSFSEADVRIRGAGGRHLPQSGTNPDGER